MFDFGETCLNGLQRLCHCPECRAELVGISRSNVYINTRMHRHRCMFCGTLLNIKRGEYRLIPEVLQLPRQDKVKKIQSFTWKRFTPKPPKETIWITPIKVDIKPDIVIQRVNIKAKPSKSLLTRGLDMIQNSLFPTEEGDHYATQK